MKIFFAVISTIFKTVVGEEAQRVFSDAQAILKKVIEEHTLQAVGMVAFYPANSCIDDILVFDEQRNKHLATFYGLRQQVF